MRKTAALSRVCTDPQEADNKIRRAIALATVLKKTHNKENCKLYSYDSVYFITLNILLRAQYNFQIYRQLPIRSLFGSIRSIVGIYIGTFSTSNDAR
jgi:hypothetical protein